MAPEAYLRLSEHFKELGISRSQPIIIHSSILPLFAFTSHPCEVFDDFTSTYFEPSCVRAYPAYVLDGSPVYNPLTTQPTIGALPKYIFSKGSGVRTLTPLHNHIFVNSKVNPFSFDLHSSFGDSTDFSHFYENNFKLLLFCVDFTSACTYLHHCEVLVDVPYRIRVQLHREIVFPGSSVPTLTEINYHARSDSALNTSFNRIIQPLSSCKSYRSSCFAGVKSYCVDIRELHRCATEILHRDPLYFLVQQ